MLKKLKSVRAFLTLGLLLSLAFAGYSAYYKTKYWGFNFTPRKTTDVWTVEEHVSFVPNGENIRISMARPLSTAGFKILDEDIVAPKYKIEKETDRIELTSKPRHKLQDIYYRVPLYDNVDSRGKTKAEKPGKPQKPIMDEQTAVLARQLLEMSGQQSGDGIQQVIALFNQNPPDETVQSFVPAPRTAKATAQAVIDLLALKDVPARMARGIKLSEGKKTLVPDVMLEAYVDGMWKIYNLESGKKGLPSDFIVFQRGNQSLVDVEGGSDSTTKFSVMKSIRSSFRMAGHRAELSHSKSWFDYSIYNLPLNEQNTLKWLMIFPLAILVVVLMRNVVGIQTMGTFTPMLIAMSLVKTGFWPGLICFSVILGVGLLIRAGLSKLNLLLVPRISAVVIFVILIMQALAIVGYQWKWEIASSALFFPIIIMAWIIERASITWEEDGAANATKEIVYSVLVAVFTYLVIVNEDIRHIMFAFNEFNLVILFVVMLLGTYTGYRLTELTRFAPLAKKDGKHV